MTVPVCPKHGTPMRPSNKNDGSFYCSKKDPTSPSGYCTLKAAAPAPQATPAASMPIASGSRYDTVLTASLLAAGQIYQGTGNTDGAFEFVRRALNEFGDGGHDGGEEFGGRR